jgi:hypothetical protein
VEDKERRENRPEVQQYYIEIKDDFPFQAQYAAISAHGKWTGRWRYSPFGRGRSYLI